jgi:hypothetical protein
MTIPTTATPLTIVLSGGGKNLIEIYENRIENTINPRINGISLNIYYSHFKFAADIEL